ncbi:unnamed protein product [Gadus morhua 'NCC']
MLGLSVLCLSAALRSGMCEAACRALSGPLPSPDPQKAFLCSSPSGELPPEHTWFIVGYLQGRNSGGGARRQPARVEEGTKGGASTVAVARRRHERDLGWRERRKQPLQHQHPSARSSAWPPRRVHSSHCTPFLSNSTAINGMWLVTLLLLYSLREVHSEDGVSTRLYFVNASVQRVSFSSSVGVSLPCPAGGAPHAALRWYLAAGDDIYDVPHIRHVHANGTLQLYPFSPSAYNSIIHDNEYFCTAENQAGKIRSPSIHVKAGASTP